MSSIESMVSGAATRRRVRWGWLVIVLAVLFGGLFAYGVWWRQRFYHHVTTQELSHEVKHTNFQATIRGNSIVTLELYQAANSSKQPLVLFTSGDGGWSPFCADIAAHIAATGKTVVGFNAKDYLVNFASSRRPVSADELVSDYSAITGSSALRPGVDTGAGLFLAGWSMGAGYSVLVASDPAFRYRVDRVIAISLPTYNELAWKPTDALIYLTHGTPREKVFDAREYLPRLDPVPVVLINATDDDTAPLKEAQSLFASATGPKHLYEVKASGHHFEGGEAEFYRNLDEGFSFSHP